MADLLGAQVSVLVSCKTVPTYVIIGVIMQYLPVVVSIFSVDLVGMKGELSELHNTRSQVAKVADPAVQVHCLSKR